MPRTANLSSRERLLQAAKTLFAERGYDATTTASIARRARTSESQLLSHFKGKPGLLAAALEHGWTELNKAVRLAIARVASRTDQAKLTVDMLLSYLEENKTFRILFLLESDRRENLDRGAQEFAEILDGIFLAMSASGELNSKVAPQALRSGLLGTIRNILREQLLSSSTGFSDTLSDAQASLLFSRFLSSCLAPSAPAHVPRIEAEARDEQPWVDHYLELADQLIYARRRRIPRA